LSEIEQLRKELDELRERIAQLEARSPAWPNGRDPLWETAPKDFPPGVITC
jgi:BMFP domain-containing protein YqiC